MPNKWLAEKFHRPVNGKFKKKKYITYNFADAYRTDINKETLLRNSVFIICK